MKGCNNCIIYIFKYFVDLYPDILLSEKLFDWNGIMKQNITVQSVLPLMKKPASSRSPTRSQTSLLDTQCKAVMAPV